MSLSDRTPGASQTRSKQHAVFGGPPFPQTLAEARGPYAWDDAGRRYVDWMSALASVGLGHQYPAVEEAVARQMWNGTALSLPTQLEYEVAWLLCDTLKWPEQVRWVKTGSEATAAAMQLARAYTRRRKVISIGYHGWHEAHLPSEYLVDVPWGRLPAVEIDYRTAAVIVEPMRDFATVPEIYEGQDTSVGKYIKTLQERARQVGALFIIDEMVTGFRWAIGGASEYLGITPDLACYGKAMANGYPLACVVGPRKIMKYAHDISSTFGGEGVGLAAAKATIETYRREPVIERLWDTGRKLQAGVPELVGYPVHPHFTGSGGWTDSESVIPITQYAATKGVLVHPSGMNPTYSHSDADVELTIQVLRDSIEATSSIPF